MAGPLWTRMNARPRRSAAELRKRDLPEDAGVYAWYRYGEAIYIGTADSLKDRLGRHLSRGCVMTSSAFRRNVAEYPGISTAALIKGRSYQPGADAVAAERASSKAARSLGLRWTLLPLRSRWRRT